MKLHLAKSLLVLSIAISYTLPASAECYGDAAAMYGCAPKGGVESPSFGSEGALERFGGSSGRVIPDIARNQSSAIDNVITDQERRQMLRSIVLGRNRSGSLSRQSFTSAMNSGARPIRRSGNVSRNFGGR